ncbi:MAG: insulinase family protein, partial [Chitinophagaceae bacterium]
AFWLESDRMLSLAFGQKSLDVQKKVVCEEFKEHYINKPYGDVWHKMRELAYTTHPYRWMTIGKELSHVENAHIDDVKNFFFKHYRPVNAILVVAGHVELEKIKQLAQKWFGDIPMGEKYKRSLPQEPRQTAARVAEVYADVPLDAFIKTWHMDARLDKGYYVMDLATEVLGGGGSSRLYQALVKEKQLFSSIDCYHFGSIDKGLLAVEGKLVKGVAMEAAAKAVDEEIGKIQAVAISDTELQKVKNKTESVIAFEDMGVMSRANSLAMYELLGDAELMNTELARYQEITAADVQQYCQEVFRNDNSNTLFYHTK